MKYKILFIFICFTFKMHSQCFDCAKNLGGHTDDFVWDLKKTDDGIILAGSEGLYKYDFNCNLIWKVNLAVTKFTTDSQGNVYILIYKTPDNSIGPEIINGFNIYSGLTLYKLDKNGIPLWYKHVGNRISLRLINIFNINNTLYITGTFYDYININNEMSFNFPYTNHTRAFVAKYNFNGDLLNAQPFGTGNDDYTSSEIDKNGNLYFSRYSNQNSYYTHADIDKIDSNLNIIWTKEISNNLTKYESIFRPTLLHYNSNNDKLYLWGAFYKFADILGTIYTDSTTGFFLTQSILSEFNVTNGNLERIKQINNSSALDIPGINGSWNGNTAYLTEKNNDLYIFSSFTGTLIFPNSTISTSTYNGGGGVNDNYNNEELVLFKINLNNFNSEFILKSSGTNYYTNGMFKDAAGPILFNGNDLYLTSNFQSYPLKINNSVINNNSGNNDYDIMLYKYKLDSSINSGEIITENTCLNELTNFSLNGNFDSIIWDFGDINSIDNTSDIYNPKHQFSSSGNFHITATVVCGSNSQTIEKDIVITNHPTINSINTITSCETISGTGISSQFDTSNINSLLIGNQQNVTIEYRNSNGTILPSPLSNPYTNTNIGGDIITARAFFINNSTCFSETNIEFRTTPKPLSPTATSPQPFCIQQNANINSVTITGQNIKWYDALANGNLLANTTPLQNGITYYASQTINGCESLRTPILINIQNTLPPIGNSTQTFCASQNPTLATISVTGTAIQWYDNSTFGNILPDTTPLQDGQTYYATQTLNNCESPIRLAVTISLISTLPANNYKELFCDDLNDGTETVNLSSYNSSVISNTTNYNFSYYNSLSGAENETASSKITNFSSYKLVLGDNKIYVRINSNTPCYAVTELKLTLFSKPIINIQDIVPICENNTITIDAGAGFDSYLWSNGATTQAITIANPGNFWVTVTNDYDTVSCSSTKNFEVKKSNKATINSIETKDWTDNENIIIVNIAASSIGNYEYSIDGVNYQTSNQFTGLISGKYTVQVRDKNGCGTTPPYEVYLLMFPRFFTPNGDGYNDTWKIKFSDIEVGLTVKILDRYGKIIKILSTNSDSWDGTYNGTNLPADDYWFVVTRANGLEYKGHFSLKR